MVVAAVLEAAHLLALRAQPVDESLLQVRRDDLVLVAPGDEERLLPRAARGVVVEPAAEGPGGTFIAAQFRDRTGVNRTVAIEILECLDRLGITQRVGDARKMRKDFVPILGAASVPRAAAARVDRASPRVAP